jgi:serine O-acetyltransferase
LDFGERHKNAKVISMNSITKTYGFRELVKADAAAAGVANPSPLFYCLALVGLNRFSLVLLFRLAAAFHKKGRTGRFAAQIITRVNNVLNSSELDASAKIGPGLVVPHTFGMGWGAIRAGKNLVVLHNATFNLRYRHLDGTDHANFATCGDDVQIGPGAVILGPVKIGDGAVIGPNAVVIKDVPAGAIVVGNPAKILQRRSSEAKPDQ